MKGNNALIAKAALTVLMLMLTGQTCVVAQDFNALVQAVEKIEANLKTLIANESEARKQEIEKLQRQISETHRVPLPGGEDPIFAQIKSDIQGLREEMTRLSAQKAGQPSLNGDMAGAMAEISALKAELAAVRSNTDKNQEQLATLNAVKPYDSSRGNSLPPSSEKPPLPGINFSGFVDGSNATNHNIGTSSFGLDQVEVDIKKSFLDRASVRADLEYLNDGHGGFRANLEQGYIAWSVGSTWKWQFTFGRFNAPIGFESIDPVDMFQYSYGLVTAYSIPSNLTGVMASLTAPKLVNWSLYVVNGWDINSDNNKSKTFGTRIGFAPCHNLNWKIDAISGPERDGNESSCRTVLDCDLTYSPLSFWIVGAESNIGWESKILTGNGTAHWHGFLLMNNFQFARRFGVTIRGDYLNDRNGSRTGIPQDLKAVCLSPSVKIADGLSGLFEMRYDWSNRAAFTNADSDSKKNQVTTAFEFTYGF